MAQAGPVASSASPAINPVKFLIAGEIAVNAPIAKKRPGMQGVIRDLACPNEACSLPGTQAEHTENWETSGVGTGG
jgi:hypothetical protein